MRSDTQQISFNVTDKVFKQKNVITLKSRSIEHVNQYTMYFFDYMIHSTDLLAVTFPLD